MKKDQLTERQKAFCLAFVGPGKHCAARAARMAGYAMGSSHVTGCQLLRKPKIAATVRRLEAAAAVDMGYTRERVIGELVGAFDMAKLMQNPASMIAAMRQVALMCGFYNPVPEKVAVDLSGEVVMAKLQRLPDSALLAMIAAGSSAT